VRVTIDMGFNFHIGNGDTREEDCKQFYYYLGVIQLQQMITQESEETIRSFVRKIKVSQIRDVKYEMTHEMISELNRRFNKYGVYFEAVFVSNIIVPKDLRTALSDTTKYDVKLQNEIKKQKNKILVLNNNEEKALSMLKLNQTQEMSLL
jgi:regulator of protease activity HflC (stomatin/prohibitin superfamily)